VSVSCINCGRTVSSQKYLRHGRCSGCKRHFRRYGTERPSLSWEQRFWAHADIGDGCWNWNGNVGSNGYGRIRREKRELLAHRVAYEFHVGDIPEGLQIDHLCRNRVCVNPDHLEPVSPRENVLRGEGITALNARKTHCKHGHPFSESNTHITSEGDRECRTCRAENTRRWRQKVAA
jgi:hypothetical protein